MISKKRVTMIIAIVFLSTFIYKKTEVYANTILYDVLGRVTSIEYEDGTIEHYTYDANGNVTSSKVIPKADVKKPDSNQKIDSRDQSAGTGNIEPKKSSNEENTTGRDVSDTKDSNSIVDQIYSDKVFVFRLLPVNGSYNACIEKTNNKNSTRISIPAVVTVDGKQYPVTAISDKAFSNMKRLKSVVIGRNVKKIGRKVFEGDKNLKTVKIRSRVLKKVGKYAFRSIHRKAVFQCPKAKKTKKDKRGKMILKKYKKMIIRSGLSKSIRFKN